MKLHELLLSDFIDCSVDDNYKSLPTPETWAELQMEWSQLVGEVENVYFIRLLKEVILLESKMVKATILLSVLANQYDKNMVEALIKLGIPIRTFSKETKEADIAFADGYYKQWAITLDQKKEEMARLQGKEGSKVTRLYFDELIIEVSKYSGYQIKENEISTQKFGLLLNRLKANNQNAKSGKNR